MPASSPGRAPGAPACALPMAQRSEVGVVAAGECRYGRILTATYQSMQDNPQALAWAANVDILFGDECHTAAAATYSAVLSRVTKAYWRIGLSATPLDRSDQRSLLAVAAFGDIGVEVTAAELVALGVLAKPYVAFVRFVHDLGGRNTYGFGLKAKFQTSYKHGVAANTRRDDIIVAAVHVVPKPCLVSFKELSHGRVLAKQLERAGFNVMLVDGTTAQDKRKTARAQLKHGRVDVIVASVVFNEGIDIPEFDSVVNAAGGKSTIQTLQRLGRGMRRRPGKDRVIVVDIFDVGDRFLESHANERFNDMESEGHTVTVVTDPSDIGRPGCWDA